MEKRETEMNREFKKGEIVALDADMANSGTVEVVGQTPLRKFTRVKSGEQEWDVMTYRLSPIPEPTNESGGKMAERPIEYLGYQIAKSNYYNGYEFSSLTDCDEPVGLGETIDSCRIQICEKLLDTPPTLLNELREKADKQAIEFAEWVEEKAFYVSKGKFSLYSDEWIDKTYSMPELLQLFHNRDAIIQSNDKPLKQ